MKMKMSAYRTGGGGSPAMSDTESYLGGPGSGGGGHGPRHHGRRGDPHAPGGGGPGRFDRYERGHEFDRGHHRPRRREYSESLFVSIGLRLQISAPAKLHMNPPFDVKLTNATLAKGKHCVSYPPPPKKNPLRSNA